MDWITAEIAIGNIDDALSHDALREAGISAVLGLNHFPTFLEMYGFAWKRVELIDGEGNPAHKLEDAMKALESFVKAGHRVLVHCTEGVSRAPFVTSCHIAAINGWELAEAIEFVSARRSIANPHPALRALWQELQTSRQDVQ